MGYVAERAKELFVRLTRENDILLLYDLETTGFSPAKHRIIEISIRACYVTDESLEEYGHKTWYINPGTPLDQHIADLTGITDDFLADKPREDEVIAEIMDYFDGQAVCGYNNTRFDDRFMENFCTRNGYEWKPKESIDLYPVAQCLLRADECENFKLETVTKFFGYDDKVSQFHNAEGDTMATELVFNSLMERALKGNQSKTGPGELKPELVSVHYWSGRGAVSPRIYLETEVGYEVVKFWIDPVTGIYHMADKSQTDPYDLDYLESQVLENIGCDYQNFRG